MKNKEDLKKELIKIDHKSYGMYKTLGGSYSYGNYILHIDHVQGDPFASPSRLRFEVKKETHGFPEEYYEETSQTGIRRSGAAPVFKTASSIR